MALLHCVCLSNLHHQLMVQINAPVSYCVRDTDMIDMGGRSAHLEAGTQALAGCRKCALLSGASQCSERHCKCKPAIR